MRTMQVPDITGKLRARQDWYKTVPVDAALFGKAADEIEWLRAEVARLRGRYPPAYIRTRSGIVHIYRTCTRSWWDASAIVDYFTECGRTIHALGTPVDLLADVPTGARTCQRCFPGGDS